MTHIRTIGRAALLAAGLSTGAAIACVPGVAAADTSTDWWSSLDPISAAVAAPISPIDVDISIDGFQVLDLGTTAVATSGAGDFAIAYGANSTASAVGGFGNFASATAGATAVAGDAAPGATGNNFDSASSAGFGSLAIAGNQATFPDSTGSSFDYASANSGNTTLLGTGAEAFAGFNGSGDTARAIGQDVTSEAGLSGTAADQADFDSASAWGNLSAPTTSVIHAIAGGGNPMLGGSGDSAFVLDPLGTEGSSAVAGMGFNSDLASVVGDSLHAVATTGSNMIDILPTP